MQGGGGLSDDLGEVGRGRGCRPVKKRHEEERWETQDEAGPKAREPALPLPLSAQGWKGGAGLNGRDDSGNLKSGL